MGSMWGVCDVVYGCVLQTQHLRLIGAFGTPHSLIFQMLPGVESKLERVLVSVLFLAILADNCCYQRDIMSTHRQGELWMTL